LDTTLKRGSWKGLFLKEWAFLKWTFLALLLLNVVITVLETSHIASGLLGGNMAEVISLSNLWFFLHMYLGLVLLFTSLMNEMKRVDIWLHSPRSVAQLIGSKILFSIAAVTFSFLISGLVISILTYFGGVSSMSEVIVSYLGSTFLLVLNASFLIVIAFFFWSIYIVLHSRIGKISIFFTLFIIIMSVILWSLLWFTDWFQGIREMGILMDLRNMSGDFPFFTETNLVIAGLMPKGGTLSVGSLLLYIVLSSALFIGGTTLFQKKVRL